EVTDAVLTDNEDGIDIDDVENATITFTRVQSLDNGSHGFELEWAEDSTVHIIDSSFDNNTDLGIGLGVGVEGGVDDSTVVISGTTVSHNRVGIYSDSLDSSTLRVINSTISGNGPVDPPNGG